MLLYNIAVRSYGLAIRTAAIRDKKAAQWVRGRKHWQERLRLQLSAWESQPRIWVHCASYGEFEQGRPVIEALKQKYPGYKILLTFFSPSGYEPFKDWKGADAVAYLPLDTRANSARFLDIVRPTAVLFIKYEFWLNFLKAIRKRGIACYLVSAVFKPHHPFFKWYGNIFRQSLRTFTRLFIQDEQSGYLLKNIGIHNFEVCGDTRFDRVLQISAGRISIPEIEMFKGGHRLIVAGSTWDGDEELVTGAFAAISDPQLKLLLVPHDVNEKSIAAAEARLRREGLSYSVFSRGIKNEAQVLLLDTMGMLSRSYYYGDVAYIGGGFDGGLHNSLEAAVFKLPVTFYGSDYTKFNEAVELLALGAAVNVRDIQSLKEAWQRFLDPAVKTNVGNVLHHYFEKNRNSTERIISYIEL